MEEVLRKTLRQQQVFTELLLGAGTILGVGVGAETRQLSVSRSNFLVSGDRLETCLIKQQLL